MQKSLICLIAMALGMSVSAHSVSADYPPAGNGHRVAVQASAWPQEAQPIAPLRRVQWLTESDETARPESLPPEAKEVSRPRLAPLVELVEASKSNDGVIRLIIGQGRILTTKSPVVAEGGVAVIAIGDPSVADFEVLPNPRMLRLTGKRPGTTDLTLVTSDEKTLVYELHVQYDLSLIEARLRQSFPGAAVKISQLGEHLLLEGQARDPRQIVLIEKAVQVFLESMRAPGSSRGADSSPLEGPLPDALNGVPNQNLPAVNRMLRALPELTPRASGGAVGSPQVINLIGMPGIQQVLLQVRIAELNRTGLREIGADSFFEWGPGNLLGTKIASANSSLQGLQPGTNSTGFGIFPTGRVEFVLRALRQNSLLRVLAEPNLVALSGHEASFLAGGEFPVPVPQGNAGGAGNVTVRFKEFGVQLNFVPHIQDDDVIRLEVRPEVSTIDESLGTTLVVGGDPVPGINTRRVHTTVQLREGESLALAGLLQVSLDANTSRLPFLGELPILGGFFSNTSHKRVEKELLVIVTPYLVSPLSSQEIPSLPGDEIQDPDDFEFYFLNRIAGGKGRAIRGIHAGDDPQRLPRLIKLQRQHIVGPVGFAPGADQVAPEQSLPQPR